MVGFAALALLASRLVALRFDTAGWIYADYLREDGRPLEALASLAQSPDDSDPVRFLTLFALAGAGRLPWEMFHYPQTASSDALLLRDTAYDTNPLVANWRSDLYLELGRVNDSQRWAHEAQAMEGETPRVLERMAQTYILNGNLETARTFVRALEKVPFQAARAQWYMAALDQDPGMQSDPLVARIRPLMLRKDYVGDWSTEQILQQCLDANPSNRMAFEYLLAHYLLTSDMKGLASLAPRLKDFYRELPTHVQEALVGFRNVNGSLPPGIDGSAIGRADRGPLSELSRDMDAAPERPCGRSLEGPRTGFWRDVVVLLPFRTHRSRTAPSGPRRCVAGNGKATMKSPCSNAGRVAATLILPASLCAVRLPGALAGRSPAGVTASGPVPGSMPRRSSRPTLRRSVS